MACVAGGEDRFAAVGPPDEPPGLATDGLIEWVPIADFGRYRLPAVRADGAQRRVRLGAQRAPLSSHRAPRDVSYAWATLLPESASSTHVDGGSPYSGRVARLRRAQEECTRGSAEA